MSSSLRERPFLAHLARNKTRTETRLFSLPLFTPPATEQRTAPRRSSIFVPPMGKSKIVSVARALRDTNDKLYSIRFVFFASGLFLLLLFCCTCLLRSLRCAWRRLPTKLNVCYNYLLCSYAAFMLGLFTACGLYCVTVMQRDGESCTEHLHNAPHVGCSMFGFCLRCTREAPTSRNIYMMCVAYAHYLWTQTLTHGKQDSMHVCGVLVACVYCVRCTLHLHNRKRSQYFPV